MPMKSMSDAWDDIKALKTKRNSLREKLEKRKKERHGILKASATGSSIFGATSRKNTAIQKDLRGEALEEDLNMDTTEGDRPFNLNLLKNYIKF